MNQAIKDALTALEYWAETAENRAHLHAHGQSWGQNKVISNKELTALLYPAYQEFAPGQTGNVNRHFLTHTRVDYNYVTVGEQLNVPGVLRVVVIVDAHRHHNELICYCKAGNLPTMTLSTLQYSNKLVDVQRENVVELLRRARGVLHHWTQLLSAPYAILALRAELEQPTFSYSDEEPVPSYLAHVMNDGTPESLNGLRRRRPRLPLPYPSFGEGGMRQE